MKTRTELLTRLMMLQEMIKISDLKAQIEKNPGNFTVWLQIMINNYFKYFEDYENNSL